MSQKYFYVTNSYDILESTVPDNAINVVEKEKTISFFVREVSPETGEYLGENYFWGFLEEKDAIEERKEVIWSQIKMHRNIADSLELKLTENVNG